MIEPSDRRLRHAPRCLSATKRWRRIRDLTRKCERGRFHNQIFSIVCTGGGELASILPKQSAPNQTYNLFALYGSSGNGEDIEHSRAHPQFEMNTLKTISFTAVQFQ